MASDHLRDSLAFFDSESPVETQVADSLEGFIFAFFDFQKSIEGLDYLTQQSSVRSRSRNNSSSSVKRRKKKSKRSKSANEKIPSLITRSHLHLKRNKKKSFSKKNSALQHQWEGNNFEKHIKQRKRSKKRIKIQKKQKINSLSQSLAEFMKDGADTSPNSLVKKQRQLTQNQFEIYTVKEESSEEQTDCDSIDVAFFKNRSLLFKTPNSDKENKKQMMGYLGHKLESSLIDPQNYSKQSLKKQEKPIYVSRVNSTSEQRDEISSWVSHTSQSRQNSIKNEEEGNQSHGLEIRRSKDFGGRTVIDQGIDLSLRVNGLTENLHIGISNRNNKSKIMVKTQKNRGKSKTKSKGVKNLKRILDDRFDRRNNSTGQAMELNKISKNQNIEQLWDDNSSMIEPIQSKTSRDHYQPHHKESITNKRMSLEANTTGNKNSTLKYRKGSTSIENSWLKNEEKPLKNYIDRVKNNLKLLKMNTSSKSFSGVGSSDTISRLFGNVGSQAPKTDRSSRSKKQKRRTHQQYHQSTNSSVVEERMNSEKMSDRQSSLQLFKSFYQEGQQQYQQENDLFNRRISMPKRNKYKF